MTYTSEFVDSSVSYGFVKQLVDRLSQQQRERLIQEMNNGITHSGDTTENRFSLGQLTDRESQVLALIADGNTRKEAGQILEISHNTVSCHVTHIYEKLQISTIAEATRAAIELGLFEKNLPMGTSSKPSNDSDNGQKLAVGSR